jgi:hypothetical protein
MLIQLQGTKGIRLGLINSVQKGYKVTNRDLKCIKAMHVQRGLFVELVAHLLWSGELKAEVLLRAPMLGAMGRSRIWI